MQPLHFMESNNNSHVNQILAADSAQPEIEKPTITRGGFDMTNSTIEEKLAYMNNLFSDMNNHIAGAL